MADQQLIHDDMKFYATPEKFYFEPTINPREILVIDRLTGEASVNDASSIQIPIPPDTYKPVCGFLGIIRLISGHYLVLAKYRILMGTLNGHEIYQLAGHEIVPFARSNTHLTPQQVDDNVTYERMLRHALEAPGLYFSYGHDMTHTFQRLHSMGPEFHKMSMASRAETRFLWNGHLLKDFMDQKFARFALPLIQGFVHIASLGVLGSVSRYAVVSRRHAARAGTRLLRRGVDSQGNVANFVETEQIVEMGGEKSSFVQTRGSIPLYWTQYPNLKYKPSMQLTPENHVAAYTKHLREQIDKYGNQVLINLIDQHGKEEALERGYRAAVAAAALPSVRYEPFDFHTECKNMRYDRLQTLLHRLSHEQEEFGYFLSRGGSILLRQTGVFRTNCVDCLDRTNVVQSLLAKTQLIAVLRVLTGNNRDELPAEFVTQFNNIWADHADMISIQYSGTGALKTDFTRTGKRSTLGLIKDGVNSLTRYYKNNFCDGYRQDCIDLFLGKYIVREGESHTVPCPLRRPKDWKYYTLPSLMLAAVSMICAGAILPSEYNNTVLLYLMFWGTCLGVTFKYIMGHGPEFVDWPRLGAGEAAGPPSSL